MDKLIAQKNLSQKEKFRYYNFKGLSYNLMGDSKKAIEYYQKVK
jgi:hypothetical protein